MFRRTFLAFAFLATILMTLLLWNEFRHTTSTKTKNKRRSRGRARGSRYRYPGKISVITGKPLASHKEYDQVKSFVLFIGYPRSGHTLVSTFIDAHPNAIIANEFDLINRWENWEPHHRNKYFLFDQLYKNSRMASKTGYRSQKGFQLFKYHVRGQFQGRVQNHLKVIGLKKGGTTTRMMTKRARSKVIESIMKTVGVPFKFLHVVRNPYDNIATMLLRSKNARLRMKPDFKLNDSDALDGEIMKYFNLALRNQYLAKKYGRSLLEIQYSELIRRPKEILSQICQFLDLTCTPMYIEDCVKIVFKTPSLTRQNVIWSTEQKRRIKRNMKRFSFLKSFTFDAD